MISKERQKRIAKERIEILIKLAEIETRKKRIELARKYVDLVFRISKKTNFRLGKLKIKLCKRCNTFLIPGLTSVVRLKSIEKCVNIICKTCGEKKRYPYFKFKNKNKK